MGFLVCKMHKIKAVYLLFLLVTTASSSEEQVAERREDSSSQHIPTDKLQRRTLSWFTNLFSKGSGGSNNYYPYDYNQGHGGNYYDTNDYYGNTGTYGSSGYYPPSTYGETSYGSGFKPITYSGITMERVARRTLEEVITLEVTIQVITQEVTIHIRITNTVEVTDLITLGITSRVHTVAHQVDYSQ